MAQNITIMGASYSDVPAVELPKTGGGTASFTDVTDTTAVAEDVAQGKYFYTANGVKTEGTATGGGAVTGGITQDADGFLVIDDESGDSDYLEQYLNRTLQSYSNSNITSTTPKYMFYELGSLTSLSLPNATTIEQSGLFKTGLSTVHASDLAKVFYLGNDALRQCPSLTGVVLPTARQFGTAVFAYSTNLKYLDAGKTASGSAYLSVNTFQGCTLFDTLILRHSAVVALNNISAFASSPFASGGTGGTLYVPNDLKTQYQQASNWSTILGYANNSIVAIEGSYYETHYADGSVIA